MKHGRHIRGWLCLGVLLPCRVQAQENARAWPSAVLSNAHVRLVAYAPAAGSGYYQAARFDWSSLLGDLDVGGRRFFIRHHAGTHNPKGHDHVAGPAEEFDMEGSPPGFAEAGPGEPFLKIGVGVLRRPDAKAYSFGRDYDIVDHGAWTFTPVGSTSVVYRHDVALPGGRLGYALERRLSLAADGAGVRIARSLRNTGAEPLRTGHYAHNFVRIDDHPVGRDYRLEFGFAPQAVSPEAMPAAGILDGQSLGFLPDALERTFWVCLGGFDTTPEHNRVTVRHVPSGADVSFATDRPLADFRVYANARILCPEPFVDLDLAPGVTEEWSTEITFEAMRPVQSPVAEGGTTSGLPAARRDPGPGSATASDAARSPVAEDGPPSAVPVARHDPGPGSATANGGARSPVAGGGPTSALPAARHGPGTGSATANGGARSPVAEGGPTSAAPTARRDPGPGSATSSPHKGTRP